MALTAARRETLRSNVERVRHRIATAAARSDRPADAVTLCAVTKYVGRPEVEALLDLGVTVLGENRVQAAADRIVRRDGVSWHMIGHLQRNKARRAVALFDWIQSVDSMRLATKLDEEAARAGRTLPVLLEVNVSGEAAKTGLPLTECDDCFRGMAGLSHIELRGVMGMAPLHEDPEAARPAFRRAREVLERGREITGAPLPDLSTGMSGDFEVAIQEGATIVRVGSLLYEGVV